ncbi:hypothetical protein QE152_g23549 [Popillia japonica]|uniref:Uncharacterized protein n=1 Tax=Popillia japonica TaxID=7064 RepID=A0AAW1KGW9_POPJA
MSTEYRRAIKYPKLILSMVQKRLTWASLPKDMALEYWESTHSQDIPRDDLVSDQGKGNGKALGGRGNHAAGSIPNLYGSSVHKLNPGGFQIRSRLRESGDGVKEGEEEERRPTTSATIDSILPSRKVLFSTTRKLSGMWGRCGGIAFPKGS